jgi:hypothetical protein
MNTVWALKAPSEIVEREWEVPTDADDSLASFVVSETGVTLDASESNGDTITLTLSAGTANATATVDITATTKNGLIITEKFYLPIRADGQKLANTARDVCNFALRKVTGNDATPSAGELDDALERLSDMLGAWAGEGADLQVKLPCEAADVLYIPDWAVEGVKACLVLELYDFYDVPATRSAMMASRRGMQRIKQHLLPENRENSEFY